MTNWSMTPGQTKYHPLKTSFAWSEKKAGPTAKVKKTAAPNHTAALSTPINLSSSMTRRTLRKSPAGAKRERRVLLLWVCQPDPATSRNTERGHVRLMATAGATGPPVGGSINLTCPRSVFRED